MAMRIRRVRIENFRKLAGPVELAGIGDGMTVIAGDNEDGKSTVLEAIRAALFCRHRATGDYVDGLAPFGSRGARPCVELDFIIGKTPYRLRKAFCRKPHEALLAADGRTFEGDAAEEELTRILGFTPAKKGAPKPEEHGVWGLFWVEQGTTFLSDRRIGDAGRATLMGALEDEMGHVLGGDAGRAILASIDRQYAGFFTGKRGDPTGDYAKQRKAVDELTDEAARLRTEEAGFEAQAEELAGVRAEIAAMERDRLLDRAEEAVSAARAQQGRINALKVQRDAAAKDAEIARSAWQAARDRQQARLRQSKEAEDAGEAAARLADEVRKSAETLVPLAGAADRDAREASLAGEAAGRAQAMLDAADHARQRAQAEHDLFLAHDALGKAEAAAADADAAGRTAKLLHVDDRTLASLDRLTASAEAARNRLETAETRIELAPLDGQRVFADGVEVGVDQPLRLARRTLLRLEGFGDIIVTPGGEDLSDRQQAAERADAALTAALAAAGHADVASAKDEHQKRRALLDEERRALERVAMYAPAPGGIDALRRTVELKAREAAELGQGMAGSVLSLEAAGAAIAEARRARDAAREAATAAESRARISREALKAAEESRRALETRRAAAALLAGGLAKGLAEARAHEADDGLVKAEKRAAEALGEAQRLADAAREAWEREDPAASEAKVAQAEVDRREVASRLDSRRNRQERLSGQLEGAGGLGEKRAACEDALAQARARLDATERQAAAIRLLHQTLHDADAQARQDFAPHIAARMAPYLRDLFPGSALEFAPDTLQLRHLRRDGTEEPFASLSVGTREQLAVLTRLAFAELLLDRGQPAAVILDDALVYSDRTRLRRMQDVLLRAAERLQVLVLTCREDDYAGLAPVLRLADCVRGPATTGL